MKKSQKIEEQKWIIYRLLYLILANDPSMVRVRDVYRSIKYNAGDINIAFDLIKQDHGQLDTFNEFDIESFRELQRRTNVKRDYSDEEEKEFMQRRVFGLSNLEK